MNNNENATANFNSHRFGGIDGRCYMCDVRPSGRACTERPCPGR